MIRLYDRDRAPIDEFETRFLDHLPFIHEMTHFIQFTGTLFGLDYIWNLVGAYSAVFSAGPWTRSSFELAYRQNKNGLRDALLSYSYFREQLRPVTGEVAFSECNAATLFEGFAFNAEVSHTLSAFPELASDVSHFYDYLIDKVEDVTPIYQAVYQLYMQRDLPIHQITAHVSALIDIALMYSPLIGSWLRPDAHGNVKTQALFRTPSEVFARACRVSAEVKPIKNTNAAEFQRYQDEVSQLVGLPTTRELTTFALSHLASFGIHNQSIKGLIEVSASSPIPSPGYYLALHYLALEARLSYGDGYFFGMYNRKVILAHQERCEGWISYVDVATNKPWAPLHRAQFSSVATGSIIDAFMENLSVPRCPMKEGRPLQCWSPDEGTSCILQRSDGTREATCPFPFVEFLLGDMSKLS